MSNGEWERKECPNVLIGIADRAIYRLLSMIALADRDDRLLFSVNRHLELTRSVQCHLWTVLNTMTRKSTQFIVHTKPKTVLCSLRWITTGLRRDTTLKMSINRDRMPSFTVVGRLPRSSEKFLFSYYRSNYSEVIFAYEYYFSWRFERKILRII